MKFLFFESKRTARESLTEELCAGMDHRSLYPVRVGVKIGRTTAKAGVAIIAS